MVPFSRGLVVSCQSNPGDALHGTKYMRAMAVASEMGGAVAIRANGPEDITAIRNAVSLPIIGIWRIYGENCQAYITPTFHAAETLKELGVSVIAFDATERVRPGGAKLDELIEDLLTLDIPLMADVSTFDEGVHAAEMGVAMVATTLAGYTEYSTPANYQPDFILLENLLDKLTIPIIAEGRFTGPNQVLKALEMGAYAVVVGKAITQPEFIVNQFAQAISGFPPADD